MTLFSFYYFWPNCKQCFHVKTSHQHSGCPHNYLVSLHYRQGCNQCTLVWLLAKWQCKHECFFSWGRSKHIMQSTHTHTQTHKKGQCTLCFEPSHYASSNFNCLCVLIFFLMSTVAFSFRLYVCFSFSSPKCEFNLIFLCKHRTVGCWDGCSLQHRHIIIHHVTRHRAGS